MAAEPAPRSTPSPTRARPDDRSRPPVVALVTCRAWAELDDDDRTLVPALVDRGVEAVSAVWDDPDVDWDAFDLAVLRSTWDYTSRRAEFLAWSRSVPRLANPAPLIEWSSDKRYLQDLGEAGLPVVPSRLVIPGDEPEFPADGRFVVKPSIGAGSVDAARFDAVTDADLARDLVARIHRSGRTALIQPYLDAVDDQGETALVRIAGRASHAIGKEALLTGPVGHRADDGLFVEETITPRTPDQAEHQLADRVLDDLIARFELTEPPLYARIDLLPGPDGPVVLEVELVEPSLFLTTAQGAAERLADAITARAADRPG